MIAELSYQHDLAVCGVFLRLGPTYVLSPGTIAVYDQQSCDDPDDTA